MHKQIFAAIIGATAFAVPPAAAQQAAAPAPAASTPIVYTDDGLSRMTDLPMGIHRIEGSNTIISGHQKGGALGMLFGVAGLAIQSSANAAGGTAKVASLEDNLRFDAVAKAAELTTAILAEGKTGQGFTLTTPAAGGRVLNVTPYVAITFQEGSEVRPYIVLKSKLANGAPDESPKAQKYFCCQGKALPLTGEGGLAENGGARLKELLTQELETAIRVMLADRTQPYVRDKQKRITVKGYYPFVGKPFKIKGYDLGKYNDYALVDFASGALVFGGVNIAEPGTLEVIPPK